MKRRDMEYGLMSYGCCYRSSNIMRTSIVHRHIEHNIGNTNS